jgi:hypothetical protein
MDRNISVASIVWFVLSIAAYLGVVKVHGLPLIGQDDAYIHFRMAANGLSCRFNTNCGDDVMTSSSPLWTVLLSLVSVIVGAQRLPFAVFGINTLLLGYVASVIATWVYRRTDAITGTIICAAFTAFLLGQAYVLMESLLFSALLCRALLSERTRIETPILLGLLPFVRLEAHVFLGLYALSCGLFGSKRDFAVVLSTYALCGIMVTSSFGHVIPFTLTVKSIVYDLPIADTFAAIVPGVGFLTRFAAVALFALSIALRLWRLPIGLPHVRDWRLLIPRRGTSVLVVGSGVVVVTYVAQRILMFDWYPPTYMFGLLVALCPTSHFVGPRSIVPAICIAIWASYYTPAYLFFGKLHPSFAPIARVTKYLELSELIARGATPQTKLLTSEIGALGWKFPGRVVDALGLNNPPALLFHPMHVPTQRSHGSIGAIPLSALRHFPADYMISLPIFLEEILQEQRTLAERYLCRKEIFAHGSLDSWVGDAVIVCTSRGVASELPNREESEELKTTSHQASLIRLLLIGILMATCLRPRSGSRVVAGAA